MSQHHIQGKVALVAGGAKNLGGLLSRALAEKGARAVVVHYNSNSSRKDAEETVAAVQALGADAFAIRADLSIPRNNTLIFEDAIKAFGGVDIAINTAGLVIKKPILDITEADYDRSFDVNAKAAFFFIQAAGGKLNDHGKIVTIVSSLLAAYTPFYAVYPGSKAPVEHFTRAASKEFGARGISVNALGPGPMDTSFFYPAEGPEAVAYHKTAAALSPHSPTGLTTPSDIVPTVLHLVSDGWWITGQTIFSNGGYTTR